MSYTHVNYTQAHLLEKNCIQTNCTKMRPCKENQIQVNVPQNVVNCRSIQVATYLGIAMVICHLVEIEQRLVHILLQRQSCLHGFHPRTPFILLRFL